MRSPDSNRAFTLVELLVALSLATVVMLAMFSSYLFLGRNLTRLSYQHILEQQSRTILTTFTADVRNTKSVSAATSGGVTLNLIDGSTVAYAYASNILTRNGVPLVKDIAGPNNQVTVAMINFTLNCYTTTDGLLSMPVASTMSIKQIEISFILQAGVAGVQDQQGTLTRYQIASGRIPFVNRQLPDGS
jgi:prepilin-type N-terminal cleavage/methylation domain-containing protein